MYISNYMNRCLRVAYTHLCPTEVLEGIYSRDSCLMYAFYVEIAVHVCLDEGNVLVHDEKTHDIDEK